MLNRLVENAASVTTTGLPMGYLAALVETAEKDVLHEARQRSVGYVSGLTPTYRSSSSYLESSPSACGSPHCSSRAVSSTWSTPSQSSASPVFLTCM